MKILFSVKKEGKILIYPFWDNIEEIKSVYPENIFNYINNDKNYLIGKNKKKRYFIDGEDITIISIGNKDNISLETIRQFTSNAFQTLKRDIISDNADIFLFPVIWKLKNQDVLSSAVQGILLTDYKYEGFKFKEEESIDIEKINMIFPDDLTDSKLIIEKNETVCRSINSTRNLINGPANLITIDFLENYSRELSNNNNLKIDVFNKAQLKKMGMNLLLAVGNGGREEPRLIKLEYNNKQKLPRICLIGKGIVFDTGGINLKPSNALDDMKSDMAGAATVIGIMEAVSKMELPVNIVGLIPLAENSIDSNSYRPGDIIIAHNKKSVEIKNTDAEGRLILADTLSYSEEDKFDIVIDFATLTGAAIIALGKKITAGFFRDSKIKQKIIESSKKTGEVIWELPLFDEYREMLKNDIADLSNIGEPPREAGTIIGALFLSEFINNKNWVHFDIAGPAFIDKDSYYNKKGATGILIRTIVDFLENYDKLL